MNDLLVEPLVVGDLVFVLLPFLSVWCHME